MSKFSMVVFLTIGALASIGYGIVSLVWAWYVVEFLRVMW